MNLAVMELETAYIDWQLVLDSKTIRQERVRALHHNLQLVDFDAQIPIIIDSKDVLLLATALCLAAQRSLTIIVERGQENLQTLFSQGVLRVCRVTRQGKNKDILIEQVSAPRLPQEKKINTKPVIGGAVIIFTSGTTGAPKPVLHELTKLWSSNLPRRKQLKCPWLMCYSPGSFAGIQVILSSLAHQAKLVMTSSTDISDIASCIRIHPVGVISCTPTFARSFFPLLRHAPNYVREALSQITLGGEIADQGTLDLLSNLFPDARITHVFASTETGSVFSVSDGLSGFPLSWLKNHNMSCYLDISSTGSLLAACSRPSETLTAKTEENMIDTHDVVEVRGERVLFCGRADGVINVGGNKVFPETLEELICKLSFINDCRIYPITNPIVGALVGLEVVLMLGTDEKQSMADLNNFFLNNVPRYSRPVKIQLMSKIVQNEAGKKSRKND